MEKWEKEKNRYFWVDQSTGYRCLITRHPMLLHLCGYVIIPPSHKLAGLSGDDYDEHLDPYYPHGGITHARTFSKTGFTKVGFDCAHLDDYVPGYRGLPGVSDDSLLLRGSYRDAEFVGRECIQLAAALKAKE